MLISLIIPIYNASKYIERCLHSITQQSYTNIEVIIIDDCSTDDSLSIVEELRKQDIRIRVFRNKKKSLAGFSRNRGLKKARGEFVWFVDADDWIEADSISQLTNKIQESPFELDFILFGFVEHYYSEKGNLQIRKLPPNSISGGNNFENFLKITKGFYSMPWLYLYSRKFLIENRILFSTDVYYEDIIFVAKTNYYSKKHKVLPLPLYFHNREQHDSITQSASKKKIEDLLKAYKELINFVNGENIINKYKSLLTIRFLVFCLSRCFKTFLLVSETDKENEKLKKNLRYYKESPIMSEKSLNYLLIYIESIDDEEIHIKKEYIENTNFLSYIREQMFF